MKNNIILIVMGVLTIASLLLALPLAPLRNSFPEKISNSFNEASMTVGIDLSGKFMNGRQIVKSRQLESFSIDVNTLASKKNTIQNSNFDMLNSNDTYVYSGYLQKQNTNSKSTGNEGSGISFSKSSKGAKNSSGIQKISLISTSENKTNNSLAVGTKTLQAATKQTYADGQGGTHPGLDPETPIPSLPLGDGTAALLIFSLFFGFWKIKK